MENVWTRPKLVAALAEGKSVEFRHFWGHTPKDPERVDASCLSQWFPRPFELEAIRYATAEHFMMAAKARLFGDAASLEQILVAPTPAEAKRLGRGVTNFETKAWDRVRQAEVIRGNIAKFGEHADLKDFLLSTGEQVLVEASPRDCIWGIGLGASNPKASDPRSWRGQNLLGFALMEARRALREAI